MFITRSTSFYLAFLLTSLLVITAAWAPDPFSEALLRLKSQVVDESNSLSDWRLSIESSKSIAACSWTGVTCNKNSTSIIGLDLSGKNLAGGLVGKEVGLLADLVNLNLSDNAFSGHLPAQIFNLTELRWLDISGNNFSGEFPGGVSGLGKLVVLDALSNSFSGGLPAELSRIETLRVLNLAGSYFTGPIPAEYGDFRNLEFIQLAGNFLGGNIPGELGRLRGTMAHMEIGYNSYAGGIPWELGNMTQLQYLDIAGANLSGPIPTSLSNLTNLQSLFLFRNHLTGPIPPAFGSSLLALRSLDLSVNLISGPIPTTFSHLTHLQLLSLMHNRMSGPLPPPIARLPSLQMLHIWSNSFSGSLPDDLGMHSNLVSVDVSTNHFVGRIPPNICAAGSLAKLIVFSNNFTGALPSPLLSNCSSLVRVRLEDNSFSGRVGFRFRLLPNATYVDLSRNSFTGGIPTDFPRASRLQYFNISGNPGLGGTIPDETWSMPILQNFSASSCNISGILPPFRTCQSVSTIDLSMNSLTGSIPGGVAACRVLEKMDLANNNLTGHIPPGLANLPTLQVLDMSHNNLDGPIPPMFSNSSSLLFLNVSFNDISGSIPPARIFRSMGSSAFVGNPRLCGEPLGRCSSGLPWGSKGTGKLTRVLLLSAGLILCAALLVVAVLYYKRGSEGQWKMVSFIGLPQFTAKDVLRSFNSTETVGTLMVCKLVLPTGITVSVKKFEWEGKRIGVTEDHLTRLGNVRHKNLVRLLGFCYNRMIAYLLYDYLPNGNLADKIRMRRDWETKCRIVVGVARGLCFLHHDCYPAVPHGDLRSGNILFDENSEPQLAEFGLKFLVGQKRASFLATFSRAEAGEITTAIKDELYMDIFKFGEIILEVLTNGRLKSGGATVQSKPKEALLRELYNETEAGCSISIQEEVQLVLEVALLCTRNRPVDRPSMEDVLKLLSGLKPQRK